MSSEKFCLRWNDFETNINEAFRDLREQKEFFDVTLVCENEQIHAHKVILSACSSFFRNMLRRNLHQHPLVYLKGVKFSDLQSVLNFMYQGEVSVAQEELNSFLAVAEDLMVKGLTQNQSEREATQGKKIDLKPPIENDPKVPSISSIPKQRRYPPKQQQLYQGLPVADAEDVEIQEVVPIKSEPGELSALSSAPAQDIFTTGQPTHALTSAEDTLEYNEEDYGEYEQYQGGEGAASMDHQQMKGCQFQDPSELLQFVTRSQDDGRFHCTLCDKFSHQNSSCARNHVESNHFPSMFSYQCDQCEQTFSTKTNFNAHRTRKHKNNKKNVMF